MVTSWNSSLIAGLVWFPLLLMLTLTLGDGSMGERICVCCNTVAVLPISLTSFTSDEESIADVLKARRLLK
jgi:hypothetical protein